MKNTRLKQIVYVSTLFLIAFLTQNCTTVPTSSSNASLEKTSPVLEHLALRP